MDNLKAIYEEQCRELNMDHDTEEKAWKRFEDVAQRYNLEGDRLHWFACSLYASCRETWTPTVGSADTVVMGNCVSLTKLLRCCNISIYEFISKIKRWQLMAELPNEFRKQIELLEQNFSITFFLYQHYKNIFRQLFVLSSNSDKKNSKFRSVSKCSSGKLYDLCWYLFLCVKNERSHDDEPLDLVKSFHFLICCIDLVYLNVLADNRLDLLNQKFIGFPKKHISAGLKVESVIDEDSCIFGRLCELANVIPDEAKMIKNDVWKSIMEGFFESNTIFGDRTTFLGISSNQNFDRNLKSLNCSYEQYILSVGTFDERLLLNNQSNFNNQANTPGNGGGGDEYGGGESRQHQMIMMSPETHGLHGSRRAGGGAGGVIPEHEINSEKLRKLMEVANNFQPSEYLRIAGDAVLTKINEKLSSMTNRLSACLPSDTPEYENSVVIIINSLYYSLLEKIIRVEVNNKPHLDLKILLDTESFHTTLIICCAEIVLNSYASDLKFPWILEFFKCDAFNFYRIIELVVGRNDSLLASLHIRHLNYVEESCLERLSWLSSSSLWEIIAQNSQTLPAWIDVDANTKRTGCIQLQQHTNSPINSAFDTFGGGGGGVGASGGSSDSARKDLFNTSCSRGADSSGGGGGGGGGTTTSINSNNNSNNKVLAAHKTERLGSLNIFFRKFYKLAWLRIKELCKELNMEKDAYLKKIWTLFEHSIMKCTDLMRDRHLDQIVMCAIYIFIRVTEHPNVKFTDIMKAYRKQPQALSSTYREVLIETTTSNNAAAAAVVNSTTTTTESNTDNERKPIFKDLIYFYNKIYVQKMTPYALEYSKNKTNPENTNLLLSPHPTERPNAPKKISSTHKIFVSPMEKFDIRHSPDSFVFGIGTSPAKDLQRMNDVVKRGKRNLPFTEETTTTTSMNCKEQKLTPPVYLSTIQGILNDRHSELS